MHPPTSLEDGERERRQRPDGEQLQLEHKQGRTIVPE